MLEDRGSLGDGELQLPESLQGIIAARLDALSAEEKALVQDAAVIGKVFWPGALAALGGRERWALEGPLHGLERRQFVRRERRSSVAGETQHAFLHLLVRDVAYGQIPRAQRAEKHRLAAEWIESLASDRWRTGRRCWPITTCPRSSSPEPPGSTRRPSPAPARADPSRRRRPGAGPERIHRRRAFLRRSARPRLARRSRSPVSRLEAAAGGCSCPRVRPRRARGGGGRFPRCLRHVRLLRRSRRTSGSAPGTEGDRDDADVHLERAFALVEDAPLSPAEGARPGRALEVPDAGRATTRARSVPVEEVLALAEAAGSRRRSRRPPERHRHRRVVARGRGRVLRSRTEPRHRPRAQPGPLCTGTYHNLMESYRAIGRLVESAEVLAEERISDERFGLERQLRWVLGEEAVDRYWRGDWKTALALSDEFIAEVESGSPHYHGVGCRFVRASIPLARGDVTGRRRRQRAEARPGT